MIAINEVIIQLLNKKHWVQKVITTGKKTIIIILFIAET